MLLAILGATRNSHFRGFAVWSSLVKGELRLGGSMTLGPKTSRVVGVFIVPVFLFCQVLTPAFGLLAIGRLADATHRSRA